MKNSIIVIILRSFIKCLFYCRKFFDNSRQLNKTKGKRMKHCRKKSEFENSGDYKRHGGRDNNPRRFSSPPQYLTPQNALYMRVLACVIARATSNLQEATTDPRPQKPKIKICCRNHIKKYFPNLKKIFFAYNNFFIQYRFGFSFDDSPVPVRGGGIKTNHKTNSPYCFANYTRPPPHIKNKCINTF